jgi:FkbM family methyltransferase
VKRALKWLRASQPFNRVATSAVRAVLRITGRDSEVVVRHLHRVGTVECRLPNGRLLKLWSLGDDWVANEVYWRGWTAYEPETTPLFFRLAARSPATIDVGAYVGFYSLLAGHANPEGRVLALEPHPQAFERLTRNVSINSVRNVECVNAAADDVEGAGELFSVPTALPTSSSLAQAFMAPYSPNRIPVKRVTLDGLLAEKGVGCVGLVKIDTETTEADVLRGMSRTIARDRPAILCEVLPSAPVGAIEELLAPHGYDYYHLRPGGPTRENTLTAHGEWLNHLCICGSIDGL